MDLKKNVVLMCILGAISGQASAGFIVTEDAQPVSRAPKYSRSIQAQSNAPIEPSHDRIQIRQNTDRGYPAPAAQQEKPLFGNLIDQSSPTALKSSKVTTSEVRNQTESPVGDFNYRAELPDRVVIIDHGRRPSLFGKSIDVKDGSLSDILTQSIPDGYQIYGDTAVDMSVATQGSNGRWIDVVAHALKGTNDMAVIDWSKREINIMVDPGIGEALKEKKRKEEEAKIAAALAEEERESARLDAERAVRKAKYEASHWSVSADDGLLSMVLENWSKKARVQFVNRSSHDVPIESSAVFEGEFKEAVSSLMQSVAEQVGRKFRWYYTSNNVLILSDESAR